MKISENRQSDNLWPLIFSVEGCGFCIHYSLGHIPIDLSGSKNSGWSVRWEGGNIFLEWNKNVWNNNFGSGG